ncbi:MAG TPA: DUF559 domain-containing protein [Ignavibacteria bacterium]|nr:DUF559 domain-containing protein [Ignavibacteria bacterium]
MAFTPYNRKLKDNSRKLRNSSTLSEVLLWNELKAGKLRGYKFNRQKPIDNFIVDFYCKKLSLAVEIDGESHIGKEEYDKIRIEIIEAHNIYVLIFPDEYVKKTKNIVLNKLNEYIDRFEDGTLDEFIGNELV